MASVDSNKCSGNAHSAFGGKEEFEEPSEF
jgi:hypothetical protein